MTSVIAHGNRIRDNKRKKNNRNDRERFEEDTGRKRMRGKQNRTEWNGIEGDGRSRMTQRRRENTMDHKGRE
jgi:hypothetical protein